MSRNRLDEMFRHCADLGIDVEWAPMHVRKHGEYCRDENRIVLNPRLTQRQVTACLAHELGHERFGDTCTTPPIERRAWEYGAALAVRPSEYRRAEELVGCHPSALAIELGVTPALITAWRRWWAKRGQHLAMYAEVLTCQHPSDFDGC